MVSSSAKALKHTSGCDSLRRSGCLFKNSSTSLILNRMARDCLDNPFPRTWRLISFALLSSSAYTASLQGTGKTDEPRGLMNFRALMSHRRSSLPSGKPMGISMRQRLPRKEPYNLPRQVLYISISHVKKTALFSHKNSGHRVAFHVFVS